MKKLTLSLVAVCSLLLTGIATSFAEVTDYQVTGPVLAVTDTTITVQKGKEKWDIAKGASTTGAADVKVGDKVTIHYTMTATTIESKPVPAAKKEKTAAEKPAKASAKGAAATPATSTEGAKPAAAAAPGSSPSAQ